MTVYLDNNATTPLDEPVREGMIPFLREHFGNPSSIHREGRIVRAALDRAREQVAGLVNAHPSQVIFTSGGTEANNLALKGMTTGRPPHRIAVSAVEHASVMAPAQALARAGWHLDLIDVDGDGRVRESSLRSVLDGRPAVVSVMWANNETGVIQDIATISAAARDAGVVLHTDAIQAAGKIPVDFAGSGVRLMSLSAHKLYGPKGVGALIRDKALDLEPLLHGGGHEAGYRSGTENVAGIVGFGIAAERARLELQQRQQRLSTLRRYLEQRLQQLPGITILAAAAPRLPNTVAIAVPGLAGETLLMQLDGLGIAVSSGSACSSTKADTSHVLKAMKLDEALAESSLRISLGKDTTEADIDQLIAALDGLTGKMKAFAASMMR